MLAAFDVHYSKDGWASAAAVLFCDYKDAAPSSSYTRILPDIAAYVPGKFYKRELPCILKLLEHIDQEIHEIIVDGYVWLGTQPGLGQHLYQSLGDNMGVIGVAKTKFVGSSGAEVVRGKSLRPLYITAAGLDQAAAAQKILNMHGAYRIPELLKQVDLIARATALKYRMSASWSQTLQ